MKKPANGRALGIALLSVMAVAFSASSAMPRLAGASAREAQKEYPREQTLVTAGNQWGNIAGFNPFFENHAMGTVGLCYETLLRYDPLKDRYINWLAKSAKFTGKKTFVVVIRDRITWANGTPFTPRDVAWTLKLGRFESAPWHELYANVKSIKTAKSKVRVKVKVKAGVKGNTKNRIKIRTKQVRNKVVVEFRDIPSYSRWQTLVWNLPIVSRREGSRRIRDAQSLESFDPSKRAGGKLTAPIGTGPYTLDLDGFDATARVVWKKKAWWAAKQKLSPSPRPKYVIDVSTSGVSATAGLLSGATDLDDRYLDDLGAMVSQGQVGSFFRAAPYHLSAGTTWLTPNTKRMPLDDPAFRRALATSINTKAIVDDVYRGQALRADATGLLPTWAKWISDEVKIAFSYSVPSARSMLATAGYKDLDGDGFVENKDGSRIDLAIQVPQGWSDWAAARDLIVGDAAAVGIRLHKLDEEYALHRKRRNEGDFDLILDNSYRLSDDPWTYFDGNFRLPLGSGASGQTDANFQRYENPAAWRLVQQLEKTPLSRQARRKDLMNQLEEIFLREMPNIPLWYNGMWSQWVSRYWTNWPSADTSREYTSWMYPGYWQMTTIDALSHLKPAQSPP